jgi:Protein of unknown function (DUF1761)
MREIPIPFSIVLGAAVAKMAIGALWYSRLFFLEPWLELSGMTEEQMKEGMAKALLVEFIGSLVMAFVLGYAIGYAGAIGIFERMTVGFFNWLGFVAVVTLGSVTYERKPLKLYVLNNGYLLFSILLMSAILAV